MPVVLQRANAGDRVVVAPELENVVLVLQVPKYDLQSKQNTYLLIHRSAHKVLLLALLRDVQPREFDARKRLPGFWLRKVQIFSVKFKRLQRAHRANFNLTKLTLCGPGSSWWARLCRISRGRPCSRSSLLRFSCRPPRWRSLFAECAWSRKSSGFSIRIKIRWPRFARFFGPIV